MRSIFNFILFPGMPDQGGDSEKVLSFSIDYSQGKIEDEGCIGGRKKNEKIENFEKFEFFRFFIKFNSKLAKKSINFK